VVKGHLGHERLSHGKKGSTILERSSESDAIRSGGELIERWARGGRRESATPPATREGSSVKKELCAPAEGRKTHGTRKAPEVYVFWSCLEGGRGKARRGSLTVPNQLQEREPV